MRVVFLPAITITIAVLAAGCGSTASVADPLPPSPSAVEPATTTAPGDITVVQQAVAPTTSVAIDPEPFSTVELQSITLEALSLCDRVISISFFLDEWSSYNWQEEGRLVVEGDDYIDSTDGSCVDGIIDAIEDDPHGNYPTIELTEADGIVSANELTPDEAIPLEVTDVELRDSRLTVTSLGPDLDAARDMALTHIKSMLDADPATFEATMNENMMWFDGIEPTTPEEIMRYATEDGFPWGQDFSQTSIEEYLRDYEPTLTWLADTQASADTKQALIDVAGTSDVVIYGGEPRHGRPKLNLGTDLGRYALTMTSAGWRIVAI